MQQPEGLIVPDRELELDKQNDQALDNSINFNLSFYTDLLFDLPPHMTSAHDFHLSDFTLDNDLLVDLT